jgi:DNA-binding transcriptional LysR family regulator
MLEVEHAEHVARTVSTRLSGRVRVSTDVTFARLHLMPAIKGFLDEYPHLELDVVLDDRIVDLLEEGIDVGVRSGPLEVSNMPARKLGEAPRYVVGSPEYFERCGIPSTPGELSSHSFINYSQQGGGRTWTFRQAEIERAVSLNSRLSVSALEGVRESVLAGAGIALVSGWMFTPELRSGQVIAVLTNWCLPPCEWWAVIPAGRMASVKTRALITFVQETLKQSDALTKASPSSTDYWHAPLREAVN